MYFLTLWNMKFSANRDVPSPKSSLFQIERNRGLRMESRPKSPENVSSSTLPFVAAAAAAFNAFTTSNAATSTRTSSPCQSISPTPSSTSRSSMPPCHSGKKPIDHQRETKEETDYEHPVTNSTNNNRTNDDRSSPPLTPVDDSAGTCNNRNTEPPVSSENDRARSRRRGRGSNGNDSSSNVLSVVYDVACCDGPVKFHRVLNENYSSSSCGPSAMPQSRLQRPCFEENDGSGENDENGGPGGGGPCDPIEAGMDTSNNGGNYTCGYCRHTFKSQYCYRKHTKRHLLPTRVNESIGNRQRQQDTGARNRREVRLLDLNVQYYPCKICGCKFPSYYFVHKHRKLCHANTEERAQSDEANSTVTEDQESTTSTTNNERQWEEVCVWFSWRKRKR